MLKEPKGQAEIKSILSIGEEISAYMDEESHLLPNGRSPLERPRAKLLKTWEGYHLVSAALKGDLPELIEIDLWKRVQKALEQDHNPMTEEEWSALMESPRVLYKFWASLCGSFSAISTVALKKNQK